MSCFENSIYWFFYFLCCPSTKFIYNVSKSYIHTETTFSCQHIEISITFSKSAFSNYSRSGNVIAPEVEISLSNWKTKSTKVGLESWNQFLLRYPQSPRRRSAKHGMNWYSAKYTCIHKLSESARKENCLIVLQFQTD